MCGRGWTPLGPARQRCSPHSGPSPKAEWQVAEAEALVHTLDGWSVVERMVVPTKTPDGKLIFSRGTLQHLTGGSSTHSLALPSSS